MSVYKLYYFDARGRAEPARMMFKLVGQQFEDVRIKPDEWFAGINRPESPFGKMPVLDVDGVLLCQSKAIDRLLAKTFGLYGDTAIEQAITDMVIYCFTDTLEDYFLNGAPGEYTNVPTTHKTEAKQKWIDEKLPTYLKKLEALATPTGFLPDKKKLMWCDIGLYHMVESLEFFALTGDPIDLSAYPKLSAIYKTVKENPRIAEWIQNRPKTTL